MVPDPNGQADLFIPAMKMAVYYPSICIDNMFTLDIDSLFLQIKNCLAVHEGQDLEHHIMLTTTSSILSNSASKSAFFLFNQVKIMRALQDDHRLNQLQFVQVHPVNSAADVIDAVASLVASFSPPISEIADKLVHSATVVKFEESRFSALQLLGEGDLSLHNTYTLIDGLGSAKRICTASVEELKLNCILKADVAAKLHARLRGLKT